MNAIELKVCPCCSDPTSHWPLFPSRWHRVNFLDESSNGNIDLTAEDCLTVPNVRTHVCSPSVCMYIDRTTCIYKVCVKPPRFYQKRHSFIVKFTWVWETNSRFTRRNGDGKGVRTVRILPSVQMVHHPTTLALNKTNMTSIWFIRRHTQTRWELLNSQRNWRREKSTWAKFLRGLLKKKHLSANGFTSARFKWTAPPSLQLSSIHIWLVGMKGKSQNKQSVWTIESIMEANWNKMMMFLYWKASVSSVGIEFEECRVMRFPFQTKGFVVLIGRDVAFVCILTAEEAGTRQNARCCFSHSPSFFPTW